MLPIGSVVITDVVDAKVMIYARKVEREGDKEVIFDMLPYPHQGDSKRTF
ncbi:DUF4176 domain-containing protein [Shouchella lonarensis]